ncbi:hypothetical protein [Allobranchiibius sp. GilTou73]|uniref:hypothetical protein n=1 Tax=Allobranchiibius sp. GilTou73 TaxID=2904523 RepID=UPI001F33E2B1|nr:hypothetical protein [Allobranchiibius sp. GilTou73]UIJ35869.1 hypothetical protein LVQ62_05660 [Allobranchiibius sp. GilTou73]
MTTTRISRRTGIALGVAAALVAFPTAQQSASAVGLGHAPAASPSATLPATGNAIGWTAAVQHQTGRDDDHARLVMVSPAGGTVQVGDVSDDARIEDVTLGGRYVITAREVFGSTSQGDQTRVTAWDTHTRKPYNFRLAGTGYTLAFAGNGILVAPASGKGVTVRTFAGTVRTRYADVPVATGGPRGIAVSPDGRTLLQSGKQLYLRDAATGKVTRTVNPPSPAVNGSCDPTRSWTPGSFVLACRGSGAGDDRTYRVGSDGAVTALAGPGQAAGGIWPTSGGIVTNVGGEVDSGPFVLHTAKGNRTLPLGSYAEPTGSRGPSLTVVSDIANGGTVFTYDVTTGTRRTLAGTSATGGGRYTSGQTIDGNQ